MKRDEWAKHVDEWKRSGLTAEEYGRPHGIRGKKLQWWSWQLRARARKASGSPPPRRQKQVELLPVTLRASGSVATSALSNPPSAGRVQIVLPNGTIVHAEPNVDAIWLGKVVAVAGASPC